MAFLNPEEHDFLKTVSRINYVNPFLPERVQYEREALGYDFEGFDRTIDVHVLNLRRKLESDPSHPIYIKTVYGVGYKFVGGEE